jgi:transposase-like protein
MVLKNKPWVKPLSLIDFSRQFSDDNVCNDYLLQLRWPKGVRCPFCDAEDAYVTKIGFTCKNKECKKKFSTTVGTIFENTKAPLHIWLFLIYLSVSNKKNISSVQMAKNLGITQKSSWGMMQKIRGVMFEDYFEKLSGIIEVDECFIGGGAKWKKWNGNTKKCPILGMIERNGRLAISVIPDRTKLTLINIIKGHVEEGSTIYSDGWHAYKYLDNYYTHEFITHSNHEYVRGNIHTNTIENIWGLLRKSVKNAHHTISDKHVQSYCDQFCWKYNTRMWSDRQKFDNTLLRLLGNKPVKKQMGESIDCPMVEFQNDFCEVA